MIPAPKQRWVYKDSSNHWLVEVISADTTSVKVKYLWIQEPSSRKVGDLWDSAGLRDIFNGRSEPRWTYLEGQEAP